MVRVGFYVLSIVNEVQGFMTNKAWRMKCNVQMCHQNQNPLLHFQLVQWFTVSYLEIHGEQNENEMVVTISSCFVLLSIILFLKILYIFYILYINY